jgi:Polyketide cyclase / dehydrase and lipid transport
MPRETIVWPNGLDPSAYPIRSYNELFVPASPDAIWGQLVDATHWPDWYDNAHDVRIAGADRVLGPGTEFVWQTFGVTVRSRVLVYEPFVNIGWDAREPVGWNGFHGWKILPRDGGCLVLTEEVQRGLLAFAIKGRVEQGLLREHQSWLEGLVSQTASAASASGGVA